MFAYNRDVAEANMMWEEQRRCVHTELQRSIADVYAQSAIEYHSAGWKRWGKVHATIVELHKALADGEGIPHTYSEYYAALFAFDQGRREDCRAMHEQITERVAAANTLATEALQKGYASFMDAVKKAGAPSPTSSKEAD
jgi:hypothetical protein